MKIISLVGIIKNIDKMRIIESANKNWVIIVSILIILSAFFVLIFSDEISTSANIGDFLAGFAGSLAFLWLVAGYKMQAKELSLQREELKLQRISIQNQTMEFKKMSSLAVIDQVKSIVDSALFRLSESHGEVTKTEHFFTAMLPGPEWKIMMENSNPDEVILAYKIYSDKNTPVDTFISSYVSAAKMYLEFSDTTVQYEGVNDMEFIVYNNSRLKNIPYISTYLLPVFQFAEQRINFEPAHKIFNLAFFIATQKVTGNEGIVKDGVIEGLIEYLRKQNKDLPAIAKT